MIKIRKWPARLKILYGGAGLLESPFMVAFFWDPTFLLSYKPLCFGMHLIAASCLFFAYPKGEGWFHANRRWARSFAVFHLYLPVFGWMMVGVLALMKDPFEIQAAFEEEWERGGPTSIPLVFKGEKRSERVLKELDFMPIAEILAGDDVELKRGAIDRLAEMKTSEAIELLQAYRTDPSMDIRFFITSALSKIKKEFEEQLHAAKEAMTQDISKVSARIYLAKSYLQYARSHLLDETTVKSYEKETLYHLQFSIMDEQAPSEVYWMLIDLYRSQENWKKVLEIIDVLEARQKASPEEIVTERVKSYYRLGEYRKVYELLNEDSYKAEWNKELKTVANWWGVA